MSRQDEREMKAKPTLTYTRKVYSEAANKILVLEQPTTNLKTTDTLDGKSKQKTNLHLPSQILHPVTLRMREAAGQNHLALINAWRQLMESMSAGVGGKI